MGTHLSLLGIALRSWNGKVRVVEQRHLFSQDQWNAIVESAFKPFWSIYRRYLKLQETEQFDVLVNKVRTNPDDPSKTTELYPNYGEFILASLVPQDNFLEFRRMMDRTERLYGDNRANNFDILKAWKNVAVTFSCNNPQPDESCATATPSAYYLALLLASRPESYQDVIVGKYSWGENKRRNDPANLEYADSVADINKIISRFDMFDCTVGKNTDEAWVFQLQRESCPGLGRFIRPYIGTAAVNLAKQEQVKSLNNIFYLSLLSNYESLKLMTELQQSGIDVGGGLFSMLFKGTDVPKKDEYESYIYPGPDDRAIMARYYCSWAAESIPERYQDVNEHDRLSLIAIAYTAPRFIKLIVDPENNDFNGFSEKIFPDNQKFDCSENLQVNNRNVFINDVNAIPNLYLNGFIDPTMEEIWRGAMNISRKQLLDRSGQ